MLHYGVNDFCCATDAVGNQYEGTLISLIIKGAKFNRLQKKNGCRFGWEIAHPVGMSSSFTGTFKSEEMNGISWNEIARTFFD